MLNKFYVWIGKHSISLFLLALCVTAGTVIVNLVDVVQKPSDTRVYKDGIQNHIVWSIKGECFFVRPYGQDAVYLVRVEDCDKRMKND